MTINDRPDLPLIHQRVRLVAGALSCAFLIIAMRLVGVSGLGEIEAYAGPGRSERSYAGRADIVDRHGRLLATSLPIPSLYGDPARIPDPEKTARTLVELFPDLKASALAQKLAAPRRFVWIKRRLTPRQAYAANALGLPGIAIREEQERFYPNRRLAPHWLGYVDMDGRGLAGIERYFDGRLADAGEDALVLSMDMRVQQALGHELDAAMTAYRARGAAGLVMDVASGEILAMASLPDFNPNHVTPQDHDALFNRVGQGVYELGSVFKAFTLALALEESPLTLASTLDVTAPLTLAGHSITDSHPADRALTLEEIFIHSSNIGAARTALAAGPDAQKVFLGRLGLLEPPLIELDALGWPITPERWGEVQAATISYGHGLAVSPLQAAGAIAALINGGYRVEPTLLKAAQKQRGEQVIAGQTSAAIRRLFRLTVTHGTGGAAERAGLRVGGKTGSAERAAAGGYDAERLISSFVAAFPMDAPRYLVFAMVEEPKPKPETAWLRPTGGIAAAPIAGNVIERIAPILGIAPDMTVADPSPIAAPPPQTLDAPTRNDGPRNRVVERLARSLARAESAAGGP